MAPSIYSVLNTSHITSKNDPNYEESVKLITALTIHASRWLDRDTNFQHHAKRATKSGLMPGVSVEIWRVLKSARMLFDGIKIDTTGVDSYVTFFLRKTLDETSCPNTFDAFLSRVKIGDSEFLAAKRLIQQVNHLAFPASDHQFIHTSPKSLSSSLCPSPIPSLVSSPTPQNCISLLASSPPYPFPFVQSWDHLQ
jgi:hypothetical protein